MSNSTKFLRFPSAQLLGQNIVYAEREVDFTLENCEIGNSVDVLNLPKGAVPLVAGWHVTTTEAMVEVALSCPTASLTLKSAAVLGANDAAAAAYLTASEVLAADDTMRVTVSAAKATAAKVVFFCIYAVSDVRR